MADEHPSHRYSCGEEERKIAWQGVQHLWQQQLLCDATLVAGDEEFQVHRCYLASCNEYFCKMFTGSFCESTEQKVEIQGVTATGLEAVLTYMYTGEIVINDSNIADIMEASSHLQVLNIYKYCAEYLKEVVSVENSLYYLQLTDMFGLTCARRAIMEYILRNFISFAKHADFLTITADVLCHLLESDLLEVVSEMMAFESTLQWLQHDPDRFHSADKVLSHIRLGNMTIEELDQVSDILERAAVMKYIHPKLMQFAFGYHANVFSQPINYTVKSHPRAFVDSLVLFGCNKVGHDKTYALATSLKDFNNFEFWAFGETPKTLYNAGNAVLNNFLFLVGGLTDIETAVFPDDNLPTVRAAEIAGGTVCKSAYRYNPKDDSWLELAPMSSPRVHFTLTAVSDCLIAVGGWCGDSRRNSVEMYNFEENYWVQSTMLGTPLSHHAACAHNGSLYISGGLVGNETLTNSCQRFHVSEAKWEQMSPMITERFCHAMTSHHHRIFVLGGTVTTVGPTWLYASLRTEVYDTENDQWTALSDSGVTCIGSAASSGNNVFVFGDYIGDVDFPVDFALHYDYEKDEWITVGKLLPRELYGPSAACLKLPPGLKLHHYNRDLDEYILLRDM